MKTQNSSAAPRYRIDTSLFKPNHSAQTASPPKTLSTSEVEAIVDQKLAQMFVRAKDDETRERPHSPFHFQNNPSFLKSLESFNHSKLDDFSVVFQQIKHCLASSEDAAQRKRAENALRRLLPFFRAVGKTRKRFLALLKRFGDILNEASAEENGAAPSAEPPSDVADAMDFLAFEAGQVEREIFVQAQVVAEQSKYFFDRFIRKINKSLEEENLDFLGDSSRTDAISSEKMNYFKREKEYLANVDSVLGQKYSEKSQIDQKVAKDEVAEPKQLKQLKQLKQQQEEEEKRGEDFLFIKEEKAINSSSELFREAENDKLLEKEGEPLEKNEKYNSDFDAFQKKLDSIKNEGNEGLSLFGFKSPDSPENALNDGLFPQTDCFGDPIDSNAFSAQKSPLDCESQKLEEHSADSTRREPVGKSPDNEFRRTDRKASADIGKEYNEVWKNEENSKGFSKFGVPGENREITQKQTAKPKTKKVDWADFKLAELSESDFDFDNKFEKLEGIASLPKREFLFGELKRSYAERIERYVGNLDLKEALGETKNSSSPLLKLARAALSSKKTEEFEDAVKERLAEEGGEKSSESARKKWVQIFELILLSKSRKAGACLVEFLLREDALAGGVFCEVLCSISPLFLPPIGSEAVDKALDMAKTQGLKTFRAVLCNQAMILGRVFAEDTNGDEFDQFVWGWAAFVANSSRPHQFSLWLVSLFIREAESKCQRGSFKSLQVAKLKEFLEERFDSFGRKALSCESG